MSKPTHVKPSFYAFIYKEAKELALKYGYNLVLHGSMNRDLDLIAIPWVDDPKPEIDFIRALDVYLNPYTIINDTYLFSVLPGGRHSYVIDINRGGSWNHFQDDQYYLDISFTPNIYHDTKAD